MEAVHALNLSNSTTRFCDDSDNASGEVSSRSWAQYPLPTRVFLVISAFHLRDRVSLIPCSLIVECLTVILSSILTQSRFVLCSRSSRNRTLSSRSGASSKRKRTSTTRPCRSSMALSLSGHRFVQTSTRIVNFESAVYSAVSASSNSHSTEF